MKVKLEELVEEVSERTTVNNQHPVLTSSRSGIYLQEEYFKKQVASKDNTGYRVIRKGEFTYRAMSDTGEFYPNKLECIDIGIVSPAYPVFKIRDNRILPDYLKYYFKSRSFQKSITAFVQGSTRASMKFGKMKLISIDLPDKDKQNQILNIIRILESIIDKYELEIDCLNNLIKARFVEMFGLPGTDPFEYGKVKLGECCGINPKKAKDTRLADEIEVSFVSMPSVSEKGEIDPSDIRKYEVVKKGFTYFAENDVLFAKITPCMENGKGAVAKGLMNGIGFGSTEFHVLRPIEGLSNSYWIYVITSFKTFRRDAKDNMTGSAGQRRTPASFLESYEVSLPPIELQNQFAAFVAQVDKSKFAVQKSLEKTKLLFDSLMQEYFG